VPRRVTERLSWRRARFKRGSTGRRRRPARGLPPGAARQPRGSRPRVGRRPVAGTEPGRKAYVAPADESQPPRHGAGEQ